MPGDGSPRDAIVSIWGQAVGSGTFLGSGAFISPRHVLTAKHVLKKKTPKSIYLGLVDGYNSIPVHKIHRHQKVDIALIELGRDFPEQGLVRLDCVTSALEKTNIVLYGVNPDTLHRDECQDYTIGTWNARTGTYLFDHAQRKGFSGGVAVSYGYAVGVITRRHTSEQQGVMVPLYVARAWLQNFLPLLVLPNPLAIQHRDEQSQSAYTQQIRREIGDLFRRRRLRPLGEYLTEPHGGNPESILIPQETFFSIEAAIEQLHNATRKCLDRLVEHDANAAADVVDDAVRVLGRLVVLAVRETWVEEMARNSKPGAHFQQVLGVSHIALPVETEAGVEVIDARFEWSSRGI